MHGYFAWKYVCKCTVCLDGGHGDQKREQDPGSEVLTIANHYMCAKKKTWVFY